MRLWHFIVLPAVTMALTVGLARHVLDPWIEPSLGPMGLHVYQLARAALIAVTMASLIAWLAFRHKAEYEAILRSRNRALESMRDFLSSIIEGLAEAIVTLDPEGRITSWNRAAEQMFGWTAEEMVGRRPDRLLPPKAVRAGELEEIERAMREGATLRELDTVRATKNGRRINVSVTRSPMFDSAGRYTGWTSILRDITAVKEMQRQLLQKERLAAIGELAASVAHEIKNPLAGVRGAAEVLGRRYHSDGQERDICREIVGQIDRLDRTVQELLIFARPQHPRRVPTDMHEVMDRVVAVVREDPTAREVEVERNYDSSMPPLRVDPQQMEQVFFNVLVNAFQAMEGRGKVLISSRLNGRDAEFRVRDTGPGIAPGILEEIFKPFFTTRTRGTGLGLSIVKNLVEANGGTVCAESRPGQGAEFRIILPRAG